MGQKFIIGICATWTAIGLVCCVASAGDLDPPVGPVAPTMKPLSEVEPRVGLSNNVDGVTPIVIDEPGSYYLLENIQGLAGEHGIEIASSDVTLDLMGFTVRGNLELGSLDGIHVTGDGVGNKRTNITIRNGVVRDFGNDGIDLVFARNGLLEGLRISNNGLASGGGNGVFDGTSFTVRDCQSYFNRLGGGQFTGRGFDIGGDSTIIGCTAEDNDLDGFNVGGGSTVTACAAMNNGEEGFEVASGSVINSCSARSNDGTGIRGGNGLAVIGCSSSNNTVHGIEIFARSLVTNSVAIDNDGDGIVAASSLVRGNVARGNAGDDISAGSSTLIDNH